MALINRISRLFRADMHAVLDRLEEPDVLLKQAVREMEESIAADEQRVKILKYEQTQVSDRSEELGQTLRQMEDELSLCFDTENLELARGLVRRKLESERFEKFLLMKRAAIAKGLAELVQRITENRARLQAMQQKLELLSDELQRSQPTINGLSPDLTVRDDEVEVAFLREQQKRRPS